MRVHVEENISFSGSKEGLGQQIKIRPPHPSIVLLVFVFVICLCLCAWKNILKSSVALVEARRGRGSKSESAHLTSPKYMAAAPNWGPSFPERKYFELIELCIWKQWACNGHWIAVSDMPETSQQLVHKLSFAKCVKLCSNILCGNWFESWLPLCC